jgi:hypothetical protein
MFSREQAFLHALDKGYDSLIEESWAVKENWKRVSKAYFNAIANNLERNGIKFNVWFSAGGPAVSGDIHLQMFNSLNQRGFHLFGNLDQLAGNKCFVVRTISKLGDYSGGDNEWFGDMTYENLLAHLRRYIA